MEKISSLNLSFDKVLIHWIIPGLVIVLPYLLSSNAIFIKFRSYFSDGTLTVAISGLIITSLVIGLIIDIIGTYIEVYFFDRKLKKSEDLEFDENWKKYLAISYKNEPVGQRYLRNVLMGMKFELSLGIALVITTFGSYVLMNDLEITKSGCAKIFFIALQIVFGLMLIREAFSSARSLARIRKNLVKHYYLNPDQICKQNEN